MSSVLHDLHIPAPIRSLAQGVADAGGRAWLVGGGVRDHLLGEDVKDFDVEVHGLPTHELERVLNRLGRVNAVGRSFGVFKLRPRGTRPDAPEIDVSIPRRDSNTGPGHRGIEVVGDPFMSLDEAVSRRDLTINALMVDVLTGELEDRVGGIDDLRARRLRAVDVDTFLDDPLRALRVVQFAARTGFEAEPGLIDLCRRAPLDELPSERVQGEWEKFLLRGTHLTLACRIAREAEVLQRVFPERVDTLALDGRLQAATERRATFDTPGRQWVLMLGVWLAHTDVQAAEKTLDRLCLHTIGRYPVRRQLLALLEHLPDPTATDAELRHLSVHTEVQLALAVRATLHDVPRWATAIERARTLGILTEKPAPLIRGRDLATIGVRAGREMGELLSRAYVAQLDGTLTSREEALAWAQAQRR